MVAAQPYITPKRFSLGGFGIDVSGVNQIALRATLRRASTMVNTWCNGSQIPQPFDFRGGTVTGEQHIYHIPNPLVIFPGSRRVFVNQRPLRAVTGFRMRFTATYEITLPTSNLFVNTNEGWAEIVASQPTIIGFPPLGVWYGLYEPVIEIDYTYGHQIAIADDECEAASPTLYYATYGMWDTTAAITVKIDGVTKTVTTHYTTNAADGSITFVTAPTPAETVTVSYTTTLPDAITQATGLIAVDLLGQSRVAARGMVGIESMKVAEVAITQMRGTADDYVTKNGTRIPAQAATFLAPYALGSAR